jgi:hypothetical protein
MLGLLVVACSETETAADIPGGTADVVVACAPAEPEGLAIRVWWPAASESRYLGRTPVLVRQGGAGTIGWDIGHDVVDALSVGATVVQYLRPGTSDDGATSGGVDTFGGAASVASLGCVGAYLDGAAPREGAPFAELVPHAGVRVLTGLSVGGNLVLIAHERGVLSADGVVLWESPLVDQLILEEPTLDGALDPLFVPGSCTLDAGCPFPGRAQVTGFDASAQKLFRDLDGDALPGAEEPLYEGLHEVRGDGVAFYSEEMAADAEATALVDGVPGWWPDGSARGTFWADWDATATLRGVRDEGSETPYLLLARGVDHVQLVHDHVAMAQEGLAGARFFRLNPDASYVRALGGGTPAEQPAGALVLDPVALDALPMTDLDALVLAGELELADRLTLDRWEPDLDGVLWPVSALK